MEGTGEELVGQDTCRPDVGCGVESELLSSVGRADDLGRRVLEGGHGAERDLWNGLLSNEASGVEIDDLAREVGEKPNEIARSQAAVDDVQRMEPIQCREDLNAQGGGDADDLTSVAHCARECSREREADLAVPSGC